MISGVFARVNMIIYTLIIFILSDFKEVGYYKLSFSPLKQASSAYTTQPVNWETRASQVVTIVTESSYNPPVRLRPLFIMVDLALS